MTLWVFAVQFLDGHHYADSEDATSKNIHRKALGEIGILLLERSNLVNQFFSRPSGDFSDMDKIIVLAYTAIIQKVVMTKNKI